ncbi:MAG: PspC domain-containing protein [Chloroflexaceae bacterium]|nr:PspC domain-containing protein [Chloroflexaceae bacterium]
MEKTSLDIRRLTRSRSNKMIAGVAAGIGDYLQIDPVLIRIAFVVLFFAGGIGLPMYLVCWLVMPRAEATASEQAGAELSNAAPASSEPLDPAVQLRRNWFLGAVLIAMGLFILLKSTLPVLVPFIVPAILIGAGVMLLRRSSS